MSTSTANELRARCDSVRDAPSRVALRPRYEGSNICTWIGFKHVNYLVEEAVLDHFRAAGLPARALFEEYGLGLDLVGLDTRIAHALHMDDLVEATVTPTTAGEEAGFGFRVRLTVERDGKQVRAAAATVRAVLVPGTFGGDIAECPAELAPFVVSGPIDPAAPSAEVDVTDRAAVLKQLTAGRNAFGWKWRIPYFYCHFTERVQMSGYLRQMEEVVDLFLADRDISIRQLLADRKWIPVVPASSIRILDHARMEEDLYTVFTVEDVYKEFTYSARMDCYVVRDGALLHTATGAITHGYAVIEDRRDWSLASFDDRVLEALRVEAK
ncbi:hypothetical protein ACWEKT_24715 [Nocardia takedensis]